MIRYKPYFEMNYFKAPKEIQRRIEGKLYTVIYREEICKSTVFYDSIKNRYSVLIRPIERDLEILLHFKEEEQAREEGWLV